MPVFFKNRVKNSPAHVKYTFSRDFSVIPPKTGSLFSATGNAQEQVFAVQMQKNDNFAVGEKITFSLPDSSTPPADITLSCSTNCNPTNNTGVVQVTITNNRGGDVKLKVTAPDGTEVEFTVTFADKYAFDPNGITVSTNPTPYNPVSVSVTITRNGIATEGVPVQWTIVNSASNGASITPTDGITSGEGMATASIRNSKGGEITVVATASVPTAPDQKITANKNIYFDCPNLNCDLDCGLDGFANDPISGCFICECDVQSKPILWEQLARMPGQSH